MSTANAIQLASNIQSKVGSSLLSVNSMLPPPEAAAATLQAGGGSLGVFLLQDLMFLQDKTYQCVEKVANILQSQLDLAEEKDRRERDQAAELAKEKKRLGGPPIADGNSGAGGINDNLEDIEKAIDKGTFSDLLGTGITAALLTPTFLKNIGKGLGKKLLKGTMYAAIAGFIADPIIEYVENEFDLELDEAAKKQIKLGMIGAGVGFGLAGIPGAIIGATAPMIAKVAGFITGSLNSEEVSDKNFAGTAIGGAAAAMFTAGKVGAYIKAGGLASLGAKASFGAALMSLPVIIGVGAAVALGVGAVFIAKKIDEYQEMTLNKLEKTTAKLDKEMGEWAAREEEGLFERMGINLGRLSALGEAKVATSEAFEQMGQDKEKFMADGAMQSKLTALSDTMLNYSDEALKTIMLDRTKATNFFDTVESIKGIAAQGGFGENSQMIFQQMAAFSDRVQNTAKKLLDDGVTGGVLTIVARNDYSRGADNVEKMAAMEPKVKELEKKKAEAEEILRLATLARETEDVEQKNRTLGTLRDIFSIQDTDIERAERQAKRDLISINSRLNHAQDTLQGLGVNFTYDDLEKLYENDKGALRLLIERSVNQSGKDFLEATKSQKSDKADITPIVINGGDNNSQSIMKEETYIKKLDTQGDPYYSREAYTYGSF